MFGFGFTEVLIALAPSVGVGLIFWFAMRAIIHADRRERLALARLEAQQDREDRAARHRDHEAPAGS